MQNPFDPGYFCSEDLRRFGFKSVGDDVQIAKNCTIIGLENIEIGDRVRIDVSCSIVAGGGPITLGDHVHIGAFCHLSGRGGIRMHDFSGLSQRVSIYSASDDFSGQHMTNPTVPAEYTGVRLAPCELGRHVIVGSGSVILPGVTIEEGAAVGALSLVTRSLAGWAIYAGAPARRTGERSRALLAMEAEMRALRHQGCRSRASR